MPTPHFSLLADLAVRLARSPEDVATEGLAFILDRSAAGRSALVTFLGENSPRPLAPIVHFRSQVVGDDEVRPDLEGHDAVGQPVVIIENKFWAGLTPMQPVAYLRRLPPEAGVLCIVAPAARLQLLWPEVLDRVRVAGFLVGDARVDSQQCVAHINQTLGLVMASWALILERIARALEAADEPAILADLRQIQGLAARMDADAFMPLTVEDLTGNTAARVVEYCELVDRTVELLLREPCISKKGLRSTGGAGWYGHNLFVQGFGCFLGFDARQWRKRGMSPIWIVVKAATASGWFFSMDADRGLATRFGRNSVVAGPEGEAAGSWIPVRLTEGREFDQVVAAMIRQITSIAEVLGALPQVQPTGSAVDLDDRT
jgi:hypothetical protein